MTDKEIFKIWLASNAKWIAWIKPVCFMGVQSAPITNFVIEKINYLDELKSDTAILLDLSGYDSILEGFGCAELGYMPIPLFNGTDPQENAMAVVDNKGIKSALHWGTAVLEKMDISSDAPPVFLLDSTRLIRYKMNVSVYDNSWDLYEQDLPSPQFFLKHGINKILLRAESIQRDIAKILYNFQKKGIKIFFTKGYELPKEVKIKKPPKKDRFH